MSDKTPLERDIETRELVRTPFIIKLLILILFSGLAVMTIYTFDLKRKYMEKNQEILIMKEKFRNEKALLVRELQDARERLKLKLQQEKQNN